MRKRNKLDKIHGNASLFACRTLHGDAHASSFKQRLDFRVVDLLRVFHEAKGVDEDEQSLRPAHG